jgi:hypothetical protein
LSRGLAEAPLRRPSRQVAQVHGGGIARLQRSYGFDVFRKVHLASAGEGSDGLVLAEFTDLEWHIVIVLARQR